VFLGHSANGKGAGTRRLWELSRTVLPHKHVFDFNQGLMDLGALVCTARKPRCAECPLERQCLAAPRMSAERQPAPRRGRK
jgi:A/G-specific adenine glycosylase